MKFTITTLDGKEKIWKPCSNVRSNPSNLHIQARQLIVEKYPTTLIMEEVYFPMYGRQNRVFDFVLPTHRKIYEIQGEQHFKYTPFFHASKVDFRKEQVKDLEKTNWCVENQFTLVHLCHFESIEQWKVKI